MHTESILALEEIQKKCKQGSLIVFVSGNFNIVHPGHLRLLKFAADCGDLLVVGINDQRSSGTIISEQLRLENILAINMVGHAFLLRDSSEDFIDSLRPATVVKGKEHERQFNIEQSAVDSYGGHLLFASGEIVFSSLDLMHREFKDVKDSNIIYQPNYMKRHSFTNQDLNSIVEKFKGSRVLVIGDLIVDEYISCDALGMSQEDPSIVVAPIHSELFIGGAGIVSGHAAAMGAEATYLTVSGKDPSADFAAEKLTAYDVTTKLFVDDSRPTTLKQRFRTGTKTQLRVSYLKHHDIEISLQTKILNEVKSLIGKTDLLVFSDYNYGCLPQPLVDSISELCREYNVPMVADSQSSSQIGDVSRFKGMMLMKPTEREARLASRDFTSGLVVLADKLRAETESTHLLLTLGSDGMLISTSKFNENDLPTDRLPAFHRSPKDTAGAGDALFISASLSLISGANIWRSAYLGSLVAACQVDRIGNTPITIDDILAEID